MQKTFKVLIHKTKRTKAIKEEHLVGVNDIFRSQFKRLGMSLRTFKFDFEIQRSKTKPELVLRESTLRMGYDVGNLNDYIDNNFDINTIYYNGKYSLGGKKHSRYTYFNSTYTKLIKGTRMVQVEDKTNPTSTLNHEYGHCIQLYLQKLKGYKFKNTPDVSWLTEKEILSIRSGGVKCEAVDKKGNLFRVNYLNRSNPDSKDSSMYFFLKEVREVLKSPRARDSFSFNTEVVTKVTPIREVLPLIGTTTPEIKELKETLIEKMKRLTFLLKEDLRISLALRKNKYVFDFIAKEEGFRAKTYSDTVGVKTIGYGTSEPQYEFLTAQPLLDSTTITKRKARQLMYSYFENNMAEDFEEILKAPKNVRAGLLSFLYNVGHKWYRKKDYEKYFTKLDDRLKEITYNGRGNFHTPYSKTTKSSIDFYLRHGKTENIACYMSHFLKQPELKARRIREINEILE